MAWVRFATPDGARVGFVDGDRVHPAPTGTSIWEVDGRPSTRSIPLQGIDLLPIVDPPSFRDFMSYEEHVSTLRRARGLEVPEVWYRQPVFYFSNPGAILGPTAPVRVSPGTLEFDYELEIAAVIGQEGSDLSPAEAVAHISGYVLLCDWSARDLQLREYPASLGPAKGKDSATSLGSRYLDATEFEAAVQAGIGIQARVDGVLRTDAIVGRPYWSFPQMVSYASRGTRVRPGDLIGSGTIGTGCLWELRSTSPTDPPPWLAAGQRVEIEAGLLGRIAVDLLPGAEPVGLGAPTGARP